jgi:hypothetical protein
MAAISSVNRARLGGDFKYSMTSGSTPLARTMAKVLREVPHAGLWYMVMGMAFPYVA